VPSVPTTTTTPTSNVYVQGVGFALRQSAKLVKPKLIIGEHAGKWSFKSESTLKSSSYEFTPEVQFDETRLDGEVVKVSRIDGVWPCLCVSTITECVRSFRLVRD
jgi:hypothetical protein